MEENKPERWELQARQSLLKRMVAAAMREYCRGPDAAARWAHMKEDLEQIFSEREVVGFSIKAGGRDSVEFVKLETVKYLSGGPDRAFYTTVFTFPIQHNWIGQAQSAQDEGLLSVLAQAVPPPVL